MKLNRFFTLLLVVNCSFAQFQTSAKIMDVKQSGFHEISLSPEIRSYSKQDLSDLRIFNSKGNEIPYFIDTNSEVLSNSFEEYSIVSKNVLPKKSTSLIIALPATKSKQLSLYIANADVKKNFSISGSNDQKEWFGITNSQILTGLSSSEETYVVKTISYPLSTYGYLKITFDDTKTLPINILKAGNFNSQLRKTVPHVLTNAKMERSELINKKETRLKVSFNRPNIVNKIHFTIKQPTYYKRNVIIYKKTYEEVKHKRILREEELASFELHSESNGNFTIPEIFEKEFYIKIENQDNQPLTIALVKLLQKPVSIVADLSNADHYTLKTENKTLTGPDYDVLNFKKGALKSLPKTSIYEVKHIDIPKDTMSEKPFWQHSWFMWICIVLAGLVILYFTFSLIKDLKSNSN
jgi:hypothetical protein